MYHIWASEFVLIMAVCVCGERGEGGITDSLKCRGGGETFMSNLCLIIINKKHIYFQSFIMFSFIV